LATGRAHLCNATLPVVSSRQPGTDPGIGWPSGTWDDRHRRLIVLGTAPALTFFLAASSPRSRPDLPSSGAGDVRLPFRVADALASWSQLATTIRHAREVPGLPRFLVGRFFYTDPVNTVIVVMAVFATEAIG
jgi:hypothetical protein